MSDDDLCRLSVQINFQKHLMHDTPINSGNLYFTVICVTPTINDKNI